MAYKIYLIDDDTFLCRTLMLHLEQEGYEIAVADSAEQAFRDFDSVKPDLLILDIGLPGMSGLDVIRRLKAISDIPVIFLTARRQNLDQILGLEMGAEDYITKPFDIDVLLARIRAVLRRAMSSSSSPVPKNDVQIGSLRISPSAHTVYLGEISISLTPTEFDLIYLLAKNADQVISIDDLLHQI